VIGRERLGPFAPPPPPVPRAGALLVAHPSLVDPNFRATVVLLLNHSDEGSLGLVLNRPLVSDVADVLPTWHDHVTEPPHLFQGGPVGLDSAIGLARLPGDDGEPPGLKRLVGSIAVVDLDAPPEIVAPAAAGLRVYAGHAGWGAGQLDDELAEGAWFVVDSEPGDGFRGDTETLWRDVLLRQTTTVALAATYRPDAEAN
jgi:putative transcriptional regulator